MLLVIIPLGIYTTAAAGKVLATRLVNVIIDADCFDGYAVCGRAAPQYLHGSITFTNVSSAMVKSKLGVRSNAYLEAIGL